MIRFRFGSLFTLSLLLAASSVCANPISTLENKSSTPDQRTVGAVFDSKGAAAAVGSTLDTDYDRIITSPSAEINKTAQSLLPTTAYSLTGASNALASTEESNVMGRLRSLRHSSALRPSRVAGQRRPPVVYPLQETDEALHDLRASETRSVKTSKHGTIGNYRSISPALYKETPAIPPSDTTWVEREYDETMRLVTIGAGAPNEHHRGSGEPRVRIVPNMADRVAAKALTTAGDAAGQSQIWATATNGMPRRVAITMSESNKRAASSYRGQPLASVAAQDQPINIPVASSPAASPSSFGQSGTYQPIPLSSGPMDVQSPRTLDAPQAAPVIYGADDVAGDTLTSTNAPMTTTKPKSTFVYRKIDQKAGLTTPQLGSPSPSSRAASSLTVTQPNAYAMASSPETNVVARVPTRKPTETGSLMWVDNKRETAAQTNEPSEESEPKLFASAVDSSAYGKQAIPLQETDAVNPDRRWGFFVTGTTGFGSDAWQTNSDKTKTVTAGFTTGADYRVNDQSYLGLALTYVHNTMTTGSFGDLQSNSSSLSLYGTTEYAQNAYVDGYISMGYLQMDSERTVFAGGGTTRKANATPDGFQFGGKAETGYDYKQAAWTYGPFAGFRLAYADFGSFTEEGAGNFNLKVRGLNNLSAIGSLGLNGSHRMVMSNGGILMPSLRVGYNHEFGDDQSNIKAEFANLANSAFTTKSDKKSRDWVNLSPSVTASLPNDWTFIANYEHDFFRDDVNENIFNLTAHYKW